MSLELGCHLGAIAATMKWRGGGRGEDVTRGRPSRAAGGEGEGTGGGSTRVRVYSTV